MSILPTTPSEPLSSRVKRLCREISYERPVFLPYTDYGYQPKECFLNVTHRVKTQGGTWVNGWIIWDCNDFTEAEFHRVWKTPQGKLEDITPRIDGEDHILFLPDRKRRLRWGKQGLIQPCNVTTIVGNRYVYGGVPQSLSTVENAFHYSVFETAKKMGIEVQSICDV